MKKYKIIFFVGLTIVFLSPYIPDFMIQIIWGDTDVIYASRFCGLRYTELIPSVRTFGILLSVYGLSNLLMLIFKKGYENEKNT
jgi:hypothetical protein